jgi:hypothetical protein
MKINLEILDTLMLFIKRYNIVKANNSGALDRNVDNHKDGGGYASPGHSETCEDHACELELHRHCLTK